MPTTALTARVDNELQTHKNRLVLLLNAPENASDSSKYHGRTLAARRLFGRRTPTLGSVPAGKPGSSAQCLECEAIPHGILRGWSCL
jgi:hypothetical protein